MTLSIFQIQVETNCRLDAECEAMIERMQKELAIHARRVAEDTASHFGYEVKVSAVFPA